MFECQERKTEVKMVEKRHHRHFSPSPLSTSNFLHFLSVSTTHADNHYINVNTLQCLSNL